MMRSLLLVLGISAVRGQYFGKDLGKLSELHHGVRGHVYAVDSRTIFIEDFHYDGEGPAAFFYVGSTKAPGTDGGFRVRDERGSTGVLRRYRGKDITLTLPEGKSLANVKWFSVYCDEYSVDFGNVKIPRNFDYPRPQKVSALSGVHGVSSDPIVIVDAQTLLVPNFSYDGEAPDAKFWVGQGDKPSPAGVRIPDENGKVEPLRRYDKKTIVITLPGDLTIFDIGHFGVWCEAFTVDFGHVRIPSAANVPPSLKMLGVSPQNRNQALLTLTSQPISDRQEPNQSRGQNSYQSDLKPTTYRPHLARIGASLENFGQNPFETPFNANDAGLYQFGQTLHSHLHRRADYFKPARDQQLGQEGHKNLEHEQYKQKQQHDHYRQKQLQEDQYRKELEQEQYRQRQLEEQQYRQKQIQQPQIQQHPSPIAPEQPRSSLDIVPSQEIYYHSQPVLPYQQYQNQFIQPRPFHQNYQQLYQPVSQTLFQPPPQLQPFQRPELRQYFPNEGQIQYVLSQTHGHIGGYKGSARSNVDLDPVKVSGFVVQRN